MGDLQRLNNNSEDAITEYTKALEILKTLVPAHDRSLSQIYFNLAVAHIYRSGDKAPTISPIVEKKKALGYYTQAKEVLELWLKQSAEASETDKKDMNELVVELTETIVALNAEIKELVSEISLLELESDLFGVNRGIKVEVYSLLVLLRR